MFSDMDWLFHILGLLLLEAVIKLAIMQFFTPVFVSQRGINRLEMDYTVLQAPEY